VIGARPGQAIAIAFESKDTTWRDAGVNIMVMHPGQPNCLYHREPVQDGFLVLHGECVAIVEGQERPMRQVGFPGIAPPASSACSSAPVTGRARFS